LNTLPTVLALVQYPTITWNRCRVISLGGLLGFDRSLGRQVVPDFVPPDIVRSTGRFRSPGSQTSRKRFGPTSVHPVSVRYLFGTRDAAGDRSILSPPCRRRECAPVSNGHCSAALEQQLCRPQSAQDRPGAPQWWPQISHGSYALTTSSQRRLLIDATRRSYVSISRRLVGTIGRVRAGDDLANDAAPLAEWNANHPEDSEGRVERRPGPRPRRRSSGQAIIDAKHAEGSLTCRPRYTQRRSASSLSPIVNYCRTPRSTAPTEAGIELTVHSWR